MNIKMLNKAILIFVLALILSVFFGVITTVFAYYGSPLRDCEAASNKRAFNECVSHVLDYGDLSVIGEFSTDYSLSSAARKHNVELAVRALDGTIIDSGANLSFNKTVGVRSKERGYKIAKVIVNGEYTDGIGGGVCQVSSTLYNAWVLSGLDVVQCCAHSLPSSYVELSRDATVSEFADLILRNNTPIEVYVSAEAMNGKIAIKIYGMAHGKNYRIRSELIETVKPDKAVFEEIECDVEVVTYEIMREGKVGYKSRAILEEVKDGAVLNARILREDFYKPIPPKIMKKLPRGSTGDSVDKLAT